MESTAVRTHAQEGGYVALIGTLAGVLRQAEITPEEFMLALRK